MAYCSSCGAIIDAGAKFCSQCGAPQGAAAASASVVAADAAYTAPKSVFGAGTSASASGNIPQCVYGPPAGYYDQQQQVAAQAATANAYAGSYNTSSGTYGSPVTYQAPVQENTKGNWAWWFLGFFFPLIGLILMCCWLSTRRGDARKAGFGALWGVIAGIVVTVAVAAVVWITAAQSGVLDDVDQWSNWSDNGGLVIDGDAIDGDDLAQVDGSLQFSGAPATLEDGEARLQAMGLKVVQTEGTESSALTYKVLVCQDTTGGYFVAMYFSNESMISMAMGMMGDMLSQISEAGLVMEQSGKWLAAGSQSAVDAFLGK